MPGFFGYRFFSSSFLIRLSMKKTVKERAELANKSIGSKSISTSREPKSDNFDTAENRERPGHGNEKLRDR